MAIHVTPIPRLTSLTTPAFTLGTANAAGSALTSIASDSTLLAFDTTLPAQVGTAAVGSATTAPRRDHVHAGTSLAAPSLTLGTANGAGSATTALATDSTLLAFDTTVPASVDETAATGSATVAARRDHVHIGTRIATGTYTGDGEATQAITGVGFLPQYLRIDRRFDSNQTVGQSVGANVQTYTTVVNDNAAGMGITGNDATQAYWTYTVDCIKSLDADGFTIGNGGTGVNPNVNTVLYNFYALG